MLSCFWIILQYLKKRTIPAFIKTYLVTTVCLNFLCIASFNIANKPYRWILFLLLDIIADECV